jgi:hypothetical protein
MGYCDHCEGQRFNRAQVLRALRAMRRECRRSKGRGSVENALARAIEAIRSLELPHLEIEGEREPGEWLH